MLDQIYLLDIYMFMILALIFTSLPFFPILFSKLIYENRTKSSLKKKRIYRKSKNLYTAPSSEGDDSKDSLLKKLKEFTYRNIYYIAGSTLVIFGVVLYIYYFTGGNPPPDTKPVIFDPATVKENFSVDLPSKTPNFDITAREQMDAAIPEINKLVADASKSFSLMRDEYEKIFLRVLEIVELEGLSNNTATYDRWGNAYKTLREIDNWGEKGKFISNFLDKDLSFGDDSENLKELRKSFSKLLEISLKYQEESEKHFKRVFDLQN